ncbi:alpha/beta fold hydrolase [Sphingosinicella sp. BN140058]|uniref:alpha/beta fold hydrolase n=1 Tax=Sphingosinicella sp. BN140058 TaxID=1892855 RepID=UPI0010126D72|nr:alpha/beta hydrolase [Sphingosinicella sp. BN140058]QAY78942.1 alpha/beta hydrolase [Sphingosinicella sp. BN140058]
MRLSACLLTAALLANSAFAQTAPASEKPVIVLVHGAFAESSSWDPVIGRLKHDGYDVIAAANPLRGVASDGAAISRIVDSIKGPVVLVGHSYGGPVITEAANGKSNVKALVFVAGFAPEVGESSLTLSSRFPGSTLGENLRAIALPDGDEDLYIRPDKFHAQFAADVPPEKALIMAATQRPITMSALGEPSRTATWKRLSSYVIYGTADRNIPAAVMKYMADRAHALKTIEVKDASHAVMVSHPREVAELIEDAATAR